MNPATSFVVLLEAEVWLADGEGDPPRTHRVAHAAVFASRAAAEDALCKARRYRAFGKARILRRGRAFLDYQLPPVPSVARLRACYHYARRRMRPWVHRRWFREEWEEHARVCEWLLRLDNSNMDREHLERLVYEGAHAWGKSKNRLNGRAFVSAFQDVLGDGWAGIGPVSAVYQRALEQRGKEEFDGIRRMRRLGRAMLRQARGSNV